MKGLIPQTGEFIDIGEAHPVADLFPMLAGEDMEELVASIYEQGLLQPVVLDEQGRVLDGRNRLAACARLDVIPEVVIYEGDDPDGYALTVNVARRHLTKGQVAMVAAKARVVSPENTMRQAAKQQGVSASRLAYAATVLDHAPDLVDAVMVGSTPLNDAYKVAQDRKKAATDEAAQMAKLHADAPDLADIVAEERMTLAEAMAAYRQRVKAEEDACDRFTSSLGQALVTIWAQLDPDPAEAVTRFWRSERSTHRALPGQANRFTAAGIRHASELLARLADHVAENGGAL